MEFLPFSLQSLFGDNGAGNLYSDVSSTCTNGTHHALAFRCIYMMRYSYCRGKAPCIKKSTGWCPTSQCCYIVVCVRRYGCLTVDVSRCHVGCLGMHIATCCVLSFVLLILSTVPCGRFMVLVALPRTMLQRVTNADTSTSCGGSNKTQLHHSYVQRQGYSSSRTLTWGCVLVRGYEKSLLLGRGCPW